MPISPSPAMERRAKSSTSAPTTISALPIIPDLIAAAKEALDRTVSAWRRCASSAERRPAPRARSEIAGYLGKDDAILFAACFDANGGLFEPLLGEDDAIVSDALNHASIIDGIRLSQGQALPLRAMATWTISRRSSRQRARPMRARIVIATDGVFSMDGYLAKLAEISDARRRAMMRW